MAHTRQSIWHIQDSQYGTYKTVSRYGTYKTVDMEHTRQSIWHIQDSHARRVAPGRRGCRARARAWRGGRRGSSAILLTHLLVNGRMLTYHLANGRLLTYLRCKWTHGDTDQDDGGVGRELELGAEEDTVLLGRVHLPEALAERQPDHLDLRSRGCVHLQEITSTGVRLQDDMSACVHLRTGPLERSLRGAAARPPRSAVTRLSYRASIYKKRLVIRRPFTRRYVRRPTTLICGHAVESPCVHLQEDMSAGVLRHKLCQQAVHLQKHVSQERSNYATSGTKRRRVAAPFACGGV